ncbi:MAG: hypothetical protein M9894_14295 [Planctomycetes bacterium]|nr:hypothetical protein [Planctomycetota bacterium]
MLHATSRRGLVVLLPLVLLAGCLDYSEELTLNKDGSGRLKLDFTVDMSFMAEVSKAMGEEPSPEEMRGPTREEIMEGLNVEGITVPELEVQDRGTKTRVRMTLDFANLEALGRVEGFGDDRKIEFFDEGGGKVRVVYSVDTTDLIPIEEMGDPAGEADEVEKKIREVTTRARDAVRFRARVKLPGPLGRSNGRPVQDDPTASVWTIDKEREPEKHQRLGRGKVTMMLLIDREHLPFVRELKPLPPKDDAAPGPGKR